MRIVLVVHGFPPEEKTGVENYTVGLADALGAAGCRVEVFAPRRTHRYAEFSLQREVRDRYAVNWIELRRDPQGPRDHLSFPEATRHFGTFLDRERPEVVHFQHVIKLGVELVFEAKKREIPTVYTAHDYYPVCHRYTLLRPDLSACDVRGDSAACSRCDLALGLLDGLGRLGDYQMGALPEQLEGDERERLAGVLADDPAASGLSRAEFDEAFDLRFELDGLRAQAFATFDRVVAPTQFLAEELVRGGIARERIRVLSYGIETRDLDGLPPVRSSGRPDADAPLRVAFLGGLAKHKGAHVFVRAVARRELPLEASIWGGSGDEVYVEGLRQQAGAAGVRWRGPYRRDELPEILAEVDVVVVPSLWVENQPLVIREAFAAGRPVVASRLGALPESVADGVSGLLFEPGDADDLGRALARLCEEPGLVGKLVAGIGAVKGVDEQARELAALYAEVGEGAPAHAAAAELERSLPASLVGFHRRHRELDHLPNRELFRRALRRLEDLRGRLEQEAVTPLHEMLGRALVSGSRVKIKLADADLAVDSLRRETEWLRELLQARDEEIEWLRGEVTRGREELEQAYAELRELVRAGSEPDPELVAELDELGAALDRSRADLRVTAEVGLLAFRVQRRLLMREILWRRAQMESAGKALQRPMARFLLARTGLGRRVATWKGAGPPPVPGEDGDAADGGGRGG